MIRGVDHETETGKPGALLMRVPGPMHPRAEAIRAFEESATRLRERLPRELWPVFIADAKDVWRWRVQLQCGCTFEVMTTGQDVFPDAQGDRDPLNEARLPAGEMWCRADHVAPTPYRDIVEWIESEPREFDPDPEVCPYAGMSAKDWAIIRHSEPRTKASWRVRLSCGHILARVSTDADWRPEDGPELVSEERAAEMRREFEAPWPEDAGSDPREDDPSLREYYLRRIERRWPKPDPEVECWTCRKAKHVTGYQRLGPLIPRPKPATVTAAKRTALEVRLAEVEAEASRLRKKLGRGG